MRLLVLLLLLTGALWAQPPSPSPDEGPVPTPVSTESPDLRVVKEVPRADVRVDGLAAITVGPDGTLTAEQRAKAIQQELQEAVDEAGAEPLEVRLFRKADGDYLSIGDKMRIPILEADLVVNGRTRDALEEYWLSELRRSLKLAATERAEGHFTRLAQMLALFTLVALLVDLVVTWAIRKYMHLPGWGGRILIWMTVLCVWLSSYPQTREFGLAMAEKLVIPVWWIVFVLIAGYISLRLGQASVRYYFRSLEAFNDNSPSAGPRWRQRLAMYEQVTQILVAFIVGLCTFLISFAPMNVDWWALITGAGFITAAIGLAAQDLLKDMVAGVNIVLEDQFGVGDMIRVAGAEGRVEAFTMRVTRIRDVEGSLITIPNSSLRMVTNLSNTWSQVDLKIPVGYQTDVRRALELLDEEARRLLADWPEKVAEPPEIMGLDSLGESALMIRMTVRTFPLMQFPVRRELLLRIKERFDKEGIEIPYPQRVVWLKQLGGAHVQEADGDVRGRGQGDRDQGRG